MNKVDIWMPIYPGDYLADTMHLTTEQHGAYFLLLMHAWRSNGGVPTDIPSLRAITRMDETQWKANGSVLLSFWVKDESSDRFVQRRLLAELEKSKRINERNRENGKLGGRPKNPKETQTKPNGKPKQNPNKTQSQSQSQSQFTDHNNNNNHDLLPLVGADGENPQSAHKRLTDLWCEEYANHFGYNYAFVGGRDGKAVKDLLRFGVDVGEIIEIAKAAWGKSKSDFDCKNSVSLPKFVSKFNEIRRVVGQSIYPSASRSVSCLPQETLPGTVIDEWEKEKMRRAGIKVD